MQWRRLRCRPACATGIAIDTENHQWKNNYARTQTHTVREGSTHRCTAWVQRKSAKKRRTHQMQKNAAKTKAIVNYKCPTLLGLAEIAHCFWSGATTASAALDWGAARRADKDDSFEMLLLAGCWSYSSCCWCCFASIAHAPLLCWFFLPSTKCRSLQLQMHCCCCCCCCRCGMQAH